MSQFNKDILKIIDAAIKEDAPFGDITSECTVPSNKKAKGYVVTKGDYVISGIDIAKMVYARIDKGIRFKSSLENGQTILKGQKLYSVEGNARAILLAERVTLNIIGHMMGVATKTRVFLDLIDGTKTKILDTRKTLPTLRIIQRRAVKDAGASNHRFSLSDAILVKENHVLMCGGINKVLDKIKKIKKIKTEIEVRSFKELTSILDSKNRPDIVMLDNMSPAMVKRAVEMNKGKVKLEASGGISDKNIRAYALTGVDFISLGTITHSVKSADLSFLFEGID